MLRWYCVKVVFTHAPRSEKSYRPYKEKYEHTRHGYDPHQHCDLAIEKMLLRNADGEMGRVVSCLDQGKTFATPRTGDKIVKTALKAIVFSGISKFY